MTFWVNFKGKKKKMLRLEVRPHASRTDDERNYWRLLICREPHQLSPVAICRHSPIIKPCYYSKEKEKFKFFSIKIEIFNRKKRLTKTNWKIKWGRENYPLRHHHVTNPHNKSLMQITIKEEDEVFYFSSRRAKRVFYLVVAPIFM